jgi:tetratricopeptide (TPR) repeat protein
MTRRGWAERINRPPALESAMRTTLAQVLGIVATLSYGALIAWLYATQPRSLEEVRTGAQVAAGTYQVDQARFQSGLALFRRGDYRAARDEWGRADPAQRDARTQFYLAYAYYREGWGRFHHDDALYRQGLDAVRRALALSPQGTLRAADADLKLQTPAELKAELERGLELTMSDLNPLRVLEERK